MTFTEQQLRLQDDIITCDLVNVHLRRNSFAMKECENFERRPVTEHLSWCRIDVREHGVDVILTKDLHRIAVWDDVSDVVVIVFYVWFLARLHRITKEHTQTGCAVCILFEKLVFLELRSTVCENERAQT